MAGDLQHGKASRKNYSTFCSFGSGLRAGQRGGSGEHCHRVRAGVGMAPSPYLGGSQLQGMGGWMAVVVWRPTDWLLAKIAKFLEGGEDERY